ncbi:uncharacterized protein LOC109722139 [Ananas comosus]|uniref:Uncharacterized protein LOC109722139 n=1 Tax=Ananas comosus TaxID=4615 RepID=A0A6P5GBX3_ANACO|nr:uncharacterized protein LOC109722139 [Ananas comosus]
MLEDYGSNDSEISNDDGDLHNSAAVEHYLRKVEMESRRRSPLLMDSSVAFGAADWEEFTRESEAGGFSGFSFDQDQPFQQPQTGSLAGAVEDMIRSYQASAAEPSGRNGTTHPIKNSLNDSAVSATQNPPPEKDATFDSSHGDHRSCNEQITREVIDGPSEERVSDELAPPCTDSTGTSQEVEGESTVPPAIDVACKESSFREESIAILSTANGVEEIPVAAEASKLEVNDSFDDMVLEMEEILLDSVDSHGDRFALDDRGYLSQLSNHVRDGSSTASTSGNDDVYPLAQHSSKIDRVEVIGAKQKTGDVSFGERLVGIKEYTIYILRVWSDNSQWEVERRYRDFVALYRQLNTFFSAHGYTLPLPWSNVERESRKIFGNASPNVVSERSTLIQDCLCSILSSKYPFALPSSFICFLSPGQPFYSSGLLKSLIPKSVQNLREDWLLKDSGFGETASREVSTLGKTISLVVEVRPRKSIRQLLELQHYTCAGCHKHIDAGKTLLRELVQSVGWNSSRFCQYTGQLFCSSCHVNDTAVLPARVLHYWDFTLYPVSQLAKAYLESIYDQPMLCVSAVNPLLFSKVPALLHVMGIRKKIAAMLPCIRCPFRRSIQKGLGFRRHLLESNDFFALRDLVDLSKGAFAALPVMMETISNRIFEHITQQCLECYDAGVPCNARQACNDPSSLIFPFQEAEAAKCGSCGSIFHKPCYEKLRGCPCVKSTPIINRRMGPTVEVNHGASIKSDRGSDEPIHPPPSSSTSGFFSGIFSKVRQMKYGNAENAPTVILMGSLPSTSM